MKYPRRPVRPTGPNNAEDDAINGLDELRLYEEWKREILPVLQADITDKLTPTEIINKYKALITARQVMRALGSSDTAVAASAAKDLLDRAEGKPIERKQIQHRLAGLPEAEIDAVLATKLKDLDALTDGDSDE